MQLATLQSTFSSESLVSRVIDHTSAMMGYWDTELVCQFSNRAYSEWFGKSPSQMRGIRMRDALGSIFELNRLQIEAVLSGQKQVFERAEKWFDEFEQRDKWKLW